MNESAAAPPPTRLSRKESQEETRQRLITSAVELFARNGVTATSLNAVAEHAGYSRGAVHGNFTDKNELAAAVVQSIVADLGPTLTEVLASKQSSRGRLAAYITRYLDYCRRNPAKAGAIIAVSAHISRSDTGHYGEAAEASAGDLVALFNEGQRRGEMRAFDTHIMAMSLRAVLDTSAARLVGQRSRDRNTGDEAVANVGRKLTAELIALFDQTTRAEASNTSNAFAAVDDSDVSDASDLGAGITNAEKS